MRYHNFRINIWLQIRNSSVHTVFKRELVTWMCVIFWNLSKHQIPCKQIQPTLFYLNILLFYFIEIILLNSQIEFDLRRTFCPVVCFCFCFCFGYFFCPFFFHRGLHIKIHSVHSMPRHDTDSGFQSHWVFVHRKIWPLALYWRFWEIRMLTL